MFFKKSVVINWDGILNHLVDLSTSRQMESIRPVIDRGLVGVEMGHQSGAEEFACQFANNHDFIVVFSGSPSSINHYLRPNQTAIAAGRILENALKEQVVGRNFNGIVFLRNTLRDYSQLQLIQCVGRIKQELRLSVDAPFPTIMVA